MIKYQCTIRKIALEYVATRIETGNKISFPTLLEALTFVRKKGLSFYIMYPQIKISEEVDNFRISLKDMRQRAVWGVHSILLNKKDAFGHFTIPSITK